MSEQKEQGDEEADEAYTERLRCYTEAYGELLFRFCQSVITAVKDEGLTPAAFLREHVLPLFKESEAQSALSNGSSHFQVCSSTIRACGELSLG